MCSFVNKIFLPVVLGIVAVNSFATDVSVNYECDLMCSNPEGYSWWQVSIKSDKQDIKFPYMQESGIINLKVGDQYDVFLSNHFAEVKLTADPFVFGDKQVCKISVNFESGMPIHNPPTADLSLGCK